MRKPCRRISGWRCGHPGRSTFVFEDLRNPFAVRYFLPTVISLRVPTQKSTGRRKPGRAGRLRKPLRCLNLTRSGEHLIAVWAFHVRLLRSVCDENEDLKTVTSDKDARCSSRVIFKPTKKSRKKQKKSSKDPRRASEMQYYSQEALC